MPWHLVTACPRIDHVCITNALGFHGWIGPWHWVLALLTGNLRLSNKSKCFNLRNNDDFRIRNKVMTLNFKTTHWNIQTMPVLSHEAVWAPTIALTAWLQPHAGSRFEGTFARDRVFVETPAMIALCPIVQHPHHSGSGSSLKHQTFPVKTSSVPRCSNFPSAKRQCPSCSVRLHLNKYLYSLKPLQRFSMKHFKEIHLLHLYFQAFHVPILWALVSYPEFCLCSGLRRLLRRVSKHKHAFHIIYPTLLKPATDQRAYSHSNSSPAQHSQIVYRLPSPDKQRKTRKKTLLIT